MHVRSGGSTQASTTLDESDDLLHSRMAMLGLDLDAIESRDRETYDAVIRRCASCDDRGVCAADLERDPSSPVWEAYCPNSTTFNALSEVWWLTR